MATSAAQTRHDEKWDGHIFKMQLDSRLRGNDKRKAGDDNRSCNVKQSYALVVRKIILNKKGQKKSAPHTVIY